MANPTQRRFIESRAEADLFDCRKGEGKSCSLAWAAYFATRDNPRAVSDIGGLECLMIRDTWENCRRTTQREFFKWFPPQVIGEYRAGDKEFIWKGEQIGLRGRVTFIGLDDPADAHKVASMPLGAVFFDEPAPAAGDSEGIDEFVFDTAMAQLRQPGVDWYAAKLAQNNPDESHWTYRRFWEPGTPNMRPVDALPPRQEPGFRAWQTEEPENLANLPPGYYEGLKNLWAGRPDLVRRFVHGKHGFQQVGRQVTPEWDDRLHLAHGLEPVKDVPLILLWDGGLNPTCIITQVTPLGSWLVLEAFVEDGIGTYELIADVVKPRLTTRYAAWAERAKRGYDMWRHIGDPNLVAREQSSTSRPLNSAAAVIRHELGGRFTPGPVRPEDGIEPLRAMLRRTRDGVGVVQVDRVRAKPVWHALRGGWHYHISRGGAVGDIEKNMSSHPGDAMRYGAGVLFPQGRLLARSGGARPQQPSYFSGHVVSGLGFEQRGLRVPPEAWRIG